MGKRNGKGPKASAANLKSLSNCRGLASSGSGQREARATTIPAEPANPAISVAITSESPQFQHMLQQPAQSFLELNLLMPVTAQSDSQPPVSTCTAFRREGLGPYTGYGASTRIAHTLCSGPGVGNRGTARAQEYLSNTDPVDQASTIKQQPLSPIPVGAIDSTAKTGGAPIQRPDVGTHPNRGAYIIPQQREQNGKEARAGHHDYLGRARSRSPERETARRVSDARWYRDRSLQRNPGDATYDRFSMEGHNNPTHNDYPAESRHEHQHSNEYRRRESSNRSCDRSWDRSVMLCHYRHRDRVQRSYVRNRSDDYYWHENQVTRKPDWSFSENIGHGKSHLRGGRAPRHYIDDKFRSPLSTRWSPYPDHWSPYPSHWSPYPSYWSPCYPSHWSPYYPSHWSPRRRKASGRYEPA